MTEYHKINSIYKRDERGKMLFGQYACPEFQYLANCHWVFTEKIDGTNIRILRDGQRVSFGGKTDNAQIPAPLATVLAHQCLPMVNQFREVFGESSACLYGEGYGAKIQKGGVYRHDQGFILFDVQVSDWWLNRADVEDIGRRLVGEVVPIVGEGTLFDMVERVRSGLSSQWGDFLAEGVVARPFVELRTRRGDRIITKLKTKDFRV